MILVNGSVKITPLYPHFLIMMTLTFSSEKMSFSSFLTSFNAIISFNKPEMEFKEFEPWFKSAKTRFKFSAGLNLETFDTILSGTNHILAAT